MENLHVKFEGEGSTFTLLQGKALEQKPPEKIIISGDIKTVSSFLNIRDSHDEQAGLQNVKIERAIVTVDKQALTISLDLDPENYYGVKVKGTLEKSDELLQFHINTTQEFTKEQLVKLIKFNKIYFADYSKHAELLLAFQKISSTVSINSKESSDERGNREREFVKQVTTNTPTEFVLKMPIFKGFHVMTFRVEVCLSVTEGSTRFWFESVELHEIMIGETDRIFEEELRSCEGFVIVNK